MMIGFIINLRSSFKWAFRIDLTLHLTHQCRETTLRGDDASCTRDWFSRSPRSFSKWAERLSISMRWSAWIPVRHPELLLTLPFPWRHHGRVSGQCRVCHRQLQSLTNELGLKRNRETLKLLDCRHSNPCNPCRELGPSSGWTPPSAVGTRQDSASLHLLTSSGRCHDQLTSGDTPSVWFAHD